MFHYMKKIFYLLLLTVLPMVALTACHDDDGDDLPNVKFDVEVTKATVDDGVIYVVAGDSIVVESVKVFNQEPGKSALITAATYFWDGYPLGTNVVSPYGFGIAVSQATAVGRHYLQIACPVYAVDKEAATATLQYPVQVVASKADLPVVPVTPDSTFHAIGIPTIND